MVKAEEMWRNVEDGRILAAKKICIFLANSCSLMKGELKKGNQYEGQYIVVRERGKTGKEEKIHIRISCGVTRFPLLEPPEIDGLLDLSVSTRV
ncbi:hypothetical protein J6590_024721 [Homalodisca vitripennis]|nr:hypothetical protein J6590_024721 [Homalodisca vitripennis]